MSGLARSIGFDDWKQFLEILGVPITVAIVGVSIGWWQSSAQLVSSAEQSRETALQAYYDQMTQLMIAGKDSNGTRLLQAKSNSEERTLARARTLAVLRRMDETHADQTKNADRKRYVVRFLNETDLIKRHSPSYLEEPIDEPPVVSLDTAFLNYTNMRNITLNSINFSGANLTDSDLRGADLSDADLSKTDLSNAKLDNTNLTGVNLTEANLTGASGVTEQNLEQQAKTLAGATMPDGTKHD